MTDQAFTRIEQEISAKTGILDLSKCGLTTVPGEISTMFWLKEILLDNNEIGAITNLDGLPDLKKLSFYRNTIKEITGLETLTKLESLTLSSNSIAEIKQLDALVQLTTLNLSDNKISAIEGLDALVQLTTLNLSGNRITSIEGLEALVQLTTLDFTYNAITQIRNLDNLVNLTSLGLNANRIAEINNLAKLTKLKKLGLADNEIAVIQNLQTLTRLEDLSIAGNKIRVFEKLYKLTSLKVLWAYNNHFTSLRGLRKLVESPALQELYLYPIGQNDLGIPIEHFGSGNTDNCLPVLRAYFASIKEGATLIKEIPVILVGNSTAGKTSLLYFLKDRVFPPPGNADASTHGIMPQEWTPSETFITNNMMGDTSLQDACFYLRDFGGQEYYHATHRLFFSNNAIYIVVWEQKTNKQTTENIKIRLSRQNGQVEELEQPIELFPYTYWLNNIRSIAPPGSYTPILLVQNKTDLPGNEAIDDLNMDLKDRFGIRKAFHFSLKSAYEHEKKGFYYPDFEQFIQYFLDVAKEHLNLTVRERFWNRFKDLVSEHKEDNIWTVPQMIEHLMELDAEFNKDNSLSYLIGLHHMGYIFYYHTDAYLKDYVFINPDWVIRTIYTILDYSIMENGGVFDEAHVLKNTGIEFAPLFLALLKKFELIFEDPEINKFIAPQYLPSELKNQKDFNTLSARFDSFQHPDFTLFIPDFLPRSVMIRFLAKNGENAIGQVYWKNGISFMLKKKLVLVLYDYDRKTFRVFVEDGDRYLQREVFDNLIGLLKNNLSVQLSTDGENFVVYQALVEAAETSSPNIRIRQGKIIQRSSLEHFTMDIETLKKITLDSKPDQVRSINIFISYAHEDEKSKTELLKYLNAIQNHYDDKLAVWTDEEIKPGSNWDNKIKKQLETADLILFLITNDFLNSTYIKDTEIKKAVERFKKRQQIILPVYIEQVAKQLLPFSEKQYLPGSTPLKDWKPQNKGWIKIQEGILQIIDDVKAGKFQEYFE